MGVSRPHLVTHADMRTSASSSNPSGLPSTYCGTFPYPRRMSENILRATISVTCLSPVTSSAQNRLTSELLRTL